MELKKRFNGRNNGEISCSIRELTRELHCGKDTATAALAELVEHGFIRQSQPGSFQFKIRHAALWILTEEEYDGAPPTKDFLHWRREGKNPVPE